MPQTPSGWFRHARRRAGGGLRVSSLDGSGRFWDWYHDLMSATVDSVAPSGDPAQLTVLYSTSEDGWVTAQIAEYPAAISQGQTQHEAWTNVLDALHDLTHEPTPAERLASTVQARIFEPLSVAAGPFTALMRGIADVARDHGRRPVR